MYFFDCKGIKIFFTNNKIQEKCFLQTTKIDKNVFYKQQKSNKQIFKDGHFYPTWAHCQIIYSPDQIITPTLNSNAGLA